MPNQITPRELMDTQKVKRVMVIDCRTPEEIKVTGTIPNARNIVAQQIHKAANKNDPEFDPEFSRADMIVTFCAVGARSGAAAEILTKLGYQNVANLGKFREWVTAGGSVAHI